MSYLFLLCFSPYNFHLSVFVITIESLTVILICFVIITFISFVLLLQLFVLSVFALFCHYYIALTVYLFEFVTTSVSFLVCSLKLSSDCLYRLISLNLSLLRYLFALFCHYIFHLFHFSLFLPIKLPYFCFFFPM